MLHGAVVVGVAWVAKKVGTQLTDSAWVGYAEVSNFSVTGFVSCWVIKMIPVPNSELVAGEAVRYVGNTRFIVPDTLLDNFTSVLSLAVPFGWVSGK